MQTVIPKKNVKAFGKAFQCLSKVLSLMFASSLRGLTLVMQVGNELTIETTADKCILRALSQSQSGWFPFVLLLSNLPLNITSCCLVLAYAHISFASSFFSTFVHTTKQFIKCKVNIKLCLTAFHALSSVEKFLFSVDSNGTASLLSLSCLFSSLNTPCLYIDNVIIMELVNKTGMRRTYRFSVEDEVNILQAEFSRSTCDFILVLRSAVLISLVSGVLISWSRRQSY